MTSLLKGFYKTLFSIAVPIILQNLLQTFVNMMDTIMVGRLGATEIAAVGLGNQIYFMLAMVVFGVSSGSSIFISQFWGAQDLRGIRKTFGIMLAACTTVSLVFMSLALTVPEKLLGLYSNDENVIREGVRYLKAVAFSYPVMTVSFTCQMAFRSTERVVLPMVTTAVSFVLNVIFNSLLIFGCPALGIPKFGVAGAAIATVIARTAEMIITITWSRAKKYEAVSNLRELLSFERVFVLKLIKVAAPVLLSETLWGLGITTQNSIFSHAGTESFAAFSIMNTVSQLTWVFFIGMGSASSVILGKKIGAGEEEAARAYTNRFCWFLPLMGAVIGLFLFPISRILPHIFNVSPQIITITQSMLYVLMCMYPSRAFNMLIIVGVCRSGGDTVFASVIDNVWMWALAIPLGFTATFLWNSPAWLILICLESEQMLKTVCGILRVRSGKWLHNVTK
ncbi:MATE family efflux transporter [Treponema sp.]|uniref:MATE family efflux transporter n=1 Tax=Treponema sp. TaxID=166 RepID=UPI00388EB55F